MCFAVNKTGCLEQPSCIRNNQIRIDCALKNLVLLVKNALIFYLVWLYSLSFSLGYIEVCL